MHTPGPWLLSVSGHEIVAQGHDSHDGFGIVALLGRDFGNARPDNARLIAAAPALLESLKLLLLHVTHTEAGLDESRRFAEAKASASAAIAKAEGTP